jgi:ATP/maltotriose-dependent transcriptional regulator MalT
VARATGDPDAARRDLDAALHAAGRGGVPQSYAAATLVSKAEVLLEDGDVTVARDALERAVGLADEVQDGWVAKRARTLLEYGSLD